VLAARFARERGGCSVEPLAARLARPGPDARAALAVLEALGATEVAGRAAELATSDDVPTRVAAARTLSAVATPAVGAQVLAALGQRREKLESVRAKWVSAPPTITKKEKAPDPYNILGKERSARREKTASLLNTIEKLQETRAAEAGGILGERFPMALDLAHDIVEDDVEYLAAMAVAVGRARPEGAQPVLEALAADAHVRVRAGACEGLGTLGTPEALEAARRCLQDPVPAVASATARGLGKAGAQARPVLLAALERRGQSRADVVAALGELGPREAVDALLPVLKDGGLAAARAADILARAGDPRAVEPLASLLAEPTVGSRLELIEALGTLGGEKAVEALRGELFSERPDVRAAAARAIGRTKVPERSGALEALRLDYYAVVRRAAEEALGSGMASAQGTP